MKCPDCGHENLAGEETCETCHAPIASLALSQPTGKDQKRILEGTVRELKPHPAATLPGKRTVADAIRLMRETRIGCVLIVEEERLSGIFTERDFLTHVAGLKDPARVRLADVMKPDPQCLAEDDAIAFAFHIMAVNGFRHIPIRRKDGGLGIISSRDLLRYLCQ